MILDDTSTIKAFTGDTIRVDVEHLINKELHKINIGPIVIYYNYINDFPKASIIYADDTFLKLHTLSLK